jgi:Mg2+/Co2+ transporter CorB
MIGKWWKSLGPHGITVAVLVMALVLVLMCAYLPKVGALLLILFAAGFTYAVVYLFVVLIRNDLKI